MPALVRESLRISLSSGNCFFLTFFILFPLLYFSLIDCLCLDACRDGVSESQFNQVLNIELDQIIEVTEIYKRIKNSVLLYH